MNPTTGKIEYLNRSKIDEEKTMDKIVKGDSASRFADEFYSMIQLKFEVPSGYKLVDVNTISGEMYYMAIYEKEVAPGVLSPMEQIKILFDVSGQLKSFKSFVTPVNTTVATISKDQALNISKNNSDTAHQLKNPLDAKLTVVRPNYFKEVNAPDLTDSAVLAWEVNEGSNILWIDAQTGKELGGTQSLYAEAKVDEATHPYGLVDSYGWLSQSYCDAITSNWEAIFNTLNYNNVVAQYSHFTSINSIQSGSYAFSNNQGVSSFKIISSWIANTVNDYGYHIVCHGNWDSTHHSFFIPDDGQAMYNGRGISGNWDLVMIDSCKSAGYNPNGDGAPGTRIVDSTLAQAFHTVGYSSRGYLGWTDKVNLDSSLDWSGYFFTKITHEPIQQAAAEAAASSSFYTPIKFFGDASWYGYAR